MTNPTGRVATGTDERSMSALTPQEIVQELDKHIVGQHQAKRAVAIALRNRWRRQQVEPALRAEITPKTLLMIGPTGVGKTEIARRIARLTNSPFIKVEASKYTEVGYVGRDVESMIRDLAAAAVAQVRAELEGEVRQSARQRAEDRIIDLLVPPGGTAIDADTVSRRREGIRGQLRAGLLDERRVDLDVMETPKLPGLNIFGQGADSGGMDAGLQGMLSGLMPAQHRVQIVLGRIEGLVGQMHVAATQQGIGIIGHQLQRAVEVSERGLPIADVRVANTAVEVPDGFQRAFALQREDTRLESGHGGCAGRFCGHLVSTGQVSGRSGHRFLGNGQTREQEQQR